VTASVAISERPRLAAGASLKRNRRWALITSYVFLILFAIFFLTPPYYMIVTSLKTDAEVAHLATNPWIISSGVTFEQYRLLFQGTDFLIYFKNTVIVTLCVVVITMVVSVLAAFSLSRMRFWGSGILATGIFLTYLIPDTLLFIPLFQIVRGLGLLKSTAPGICRCCFGYSFRWRCRASSPPPFSPSRCLGLRSSIRLRSCSAPTSRCSPSAR
jgi:multiple sugar transport system permease protein